MSLYRRPSRVRAPVIAGAVVVALLIGGAVGYAIGHANAPEPSAADVVGHLRSQLRPVADALQLLPTEYPQAAKGEGNESAAVTGALARLDGALASARADLVVLDPAGARALAQRIATLEAAVKAKAAAAKVAALTKAADTALGQVPGGSG
jgi:hypothetical protein